MTAQASCTHPEKILWVIFLADDHATEIMKPPKKNVRLTQGSVGGGFLQIGSGGPRGEFNEENRTLGNAANLRREGQPGAAVAD